ncbi:hypothetical protein ACFLZ9_00980 [Patescibacteria group bacterium]
MAKKIFIICPVRKPKRSKISELYHKIINKTKKQKEYHEIVQEKIEAYIKGLKSVGHQVHWPPIDTDQNDPIGIKICDTNLKKIEEADEVHVWYELTSTGSHFDLGGAYMLIRILSYDKVVKIINYDEVKNKCEDSKSFYKVLLFLHKDTNK